MRRFLLNLFFLYCTNLSAQPILTDSNLLIKPKFELGEMSTYLVTEEYKIDNLFFPITARHKFKVSFAILDTTDGYTISYSVQTLETKNKRFLVESIKAKMTDGLNLTYKINSNGWLIDLPNYEQIRINLLNTLDSILSVEVFSKADYISLAALKKTLTKPEGLEIFLSPVLMFNNVYTKPIFRKRKDYHGAKTYNIFNQPKVTGTMIVELKKADRLANFSKVSIDFIGNRESAAKNYTPIYQEIYTEFRGKKDKFAPDEMKLNFESAYEIRLSNGYPIKIENKHIEFYVQRFTSKFKMEIVE